MRRTANAILIATAMLLAAAASHATTIDLSATIDGAQANAGAGTGSTATGSATLTFDTVTKELTWTGSFAGLLGDYTVSHFHGPAGPGANATVTVGFGVTLDPGDRSGTFVGSATLNPTQEADLLAGLWYINIHSQFALGGEIRGQVLVPEPALGALVFAGLVFALRRLEA